MLNYQAMEEKYKAMEEKYTVLGPLAIEPLKKWLRLLESEGTRTLKINNRLIRVYKDDKHFELLLKSKRKWYTHFGWVNTFSHESFEEIAC